VSETFPTCEFCGGTRVMPGELYPGVPHPCPACAGRRMDPTDLEKMGRDQLIGELKGWRTGLVFRGHDRVLALAYPKLKAELEAATAQLQRDARQIAEFAQRSST